MNNNTNSVSDKQVEKILNEIKKTLGVEIFEQFQFIYKNFNGEDIVELVIAVKKMFNERDRNKKAKYSLVIAKNISNMYNYYLSILKPNRNMQAFLTLFLLNKLMCDYVVNKEKLNMIHQKRYYDSFVNNELDIKKLIKTKNKYWELLDTEIDIKKLKNLKTKLIKVDKKYEEEYERLVSLIPENEKYKFNKESFDISFGTNIENQFYECINWLQNTIIRMIKYNNSLVIVTNDIFKTSIEASEKVKADLLKEFSLENKLFFNVNQNELSSNELNQLNERKNEFLTLYKDEFEVIMNILKKVMLVKTSIPYLLIDNKKLYPNQYKKDLNHLKQTLTRITNVIHKCLNLMYIGEEVA